MINILLSSYDFGEGLLHKKLSNLVTKGMKIIVIPFSFSEFSMPTINEYNLYSDKGGKYYEIIADQFSNFGVPYDNIDLIHYYNDNVDVMKGKIKSADLLFFTGGLPDKTIERLQEKDLIEEIKKFEGIIMGASAGALIQLSEYFCTPDDDYNEFGFYKGLDLVNKEFSIEVHYEGSNLLDEYPILRSKGKRIYALPNGTGLVCSKDKFQIIGDVTTFN